MLASCPWRCLHVHRFFSEPYSRSENSACFQQAQSASTCRSPPTARCVCIAPACCRCKSSQAACGKRVCGHDMHVATRNMMIDSEIIEQLADPSPLTLVRAVRRRIIKILERSLTAAVSRFIPPYGISWLSDVNMPFACHPPNVMHIVQLIALRSACADYAQRTGPMRRIARRRAVVPRNARLPPDA